MTYLTHHLLKYAASRLGDREGLVHGGRRLSFAKLHDLVSRLAAAMSDVGL